MKENRAEREGKDGVWKEMRERTERRQSEQKEGCKGRQRRG